MNRKAEKAAKRRSGVSNDNKTALIKEALSKNPDASPTAVAASVGNGVTAKYASTVKSNMQTSRKKAAKKKRGRPKRSTSAASKAAAATGSLELAIAYIEAAGGLDAAKRQIEMIERIKRL